MKKFDALILGSGQAGNPLAIALAGSRRNVALVEKRHIGGSCINTGCTPTKTMEASGRVSYLVRRAADYGITIPGHVRVDMKVVRGRKRDIVESFTGGSRKRLEKNGVAIYMGEARFTGRKEVTVSLADGGTEKLQADWIFIDTGTRPAVPGIEGLPQCTIYNNETIMELDTVPDHLLVVGGGYVGIEFARMFQRFGSRVTIIHRGEHVLSREDDDIAEAIQDIFREDGIRIITQAHTHHAIQDPDGTINLQLTCPEGEKSVTGSHLLVATGRVPNTDMLNLSEAGVEMDEKGYIVTDSKLRTNIKGIWALGDVKGGPAFTHISYDDYRIVKKNLIEKGEATIEGRLIPYVVFIDPQLGRVGYTERHAGDLGLSYKAVTIPMNYVARALETDEPRGFMKALVDNDTGKILGFACLGIDGGELMAVVQTAMLGELGWKDLAGAIFAHPTLAESLNNLFGLVGKLS